MHLSAIMSGRSASAGTLAGGLVLLLVCQSGQSPAMVDGPRQAFPAQKTRDQQMRGRRAAGVTLAEIGIEFGLIRERVR